MIRFLLSGLTLFASLFSPGAQAQSLCPTRTVLFLCTGNFYRSRLAQAVFNYHAVQLQLNWRAVSRGLDTPQLNDKQRAQKVSPLVLQKLDELGIPRTFAEGEPHQATLEDLSQNDRVIILNRTEHQIYLDKLSEQLDQFHLEYWDIADVEFLNASEAMDLIVKAVEEYVYAISNDKAQKL